MRFEFLALLLEFGDEEFETSVQGSPQCSEKTFQCLGKAGRRNVFSVAIVFSTWTWNDFGRRSRASNRSGWRIVCKQNHSRRRASTPADEQADENPTPAATPTATQGSPERSHLRDRRPLWICDNDLLRVRECFFALGHTLLIFCLANAIFSPAWFVVARSNSSASPIRVRRSLTSLSVVHRRP